MKKILIIEDNTDLSTMYRVKLENEGFNVITAIDGEQGIVKIVQEKPEIILLDILMPNMNGMEVLKAIKENTDMDVKIIVLSNLGQKDQIDQAYSLGATHYMVKANNTPAQVVNKIKDIALIDNNNNEFLIEPKKNSYDYAKLEKDPRFKGKLDKCSFCKADSVLKLIYNDPNWVVKFVCPKCNKELG